MFFSPCDPTGPTCSRNVLLRSIRNQEVFLIVLFVVFVLCILFFSSQLVHCARQRAGGAATLGADRRGSSRQGQRRRLLSFFSSRGYVIRGW